MSAEQGNVEAFEMKCRCNPQNPHREDCSLNPMFAPVAEQGDVGPETMSGDEGDTVFVRLDLARTETAARAYMLEHDGRNLRGYDAEHVQMLPVPEHFLAEEDWWCVRLGSPGAISYWRFRV